MRFRFLHWADSHGKATHTNDILNRILPGSGVDACIHAGDICLNNFSNDVAYARLGTPSMLHVVGNHDRITPEGAALTPNDWSMQPSLADTHAKFFAPYAAAQGIEVGDGETWWRRRFPEKGVDVIGLDSQALDADGGACARQSEWLGRALDEAMDGGRAVLLASHIADARLEMLRCPWTCGRYFFESGYFPDTGTFGFYESIKACADLVNERAARGLRVIAWLHGHDHADGVSVSAGYPSVVVGSTEHDAHNDVQRAANSRTSRAVCNLYEYDDATESLHVWRLGADACENGALRRMAAFDYAAKRWASVASRA